MLALATLLFTVGFVTARAGTPAGYTEYIIPFDEDVFAYVSSPVSAGGIGATNTTFTLISVTAWSDTVTIYLDHWENGYNFDLNNPDATADEKYTLNAGKTLNFSSAAVPRPRTGADGNTYIGAAGDCVAQPTPAAPLIHNTLNFCYDGRDRIITIGGATTVTRGGYFNAPGPGKLAAIGEEVYPVAPQLTKYILPFGEYTPFGTKNDYDRVMAMIQATEDNTTIQIDFNGDGRFDWFNTENGYRTARTDGLDGSTLTLQKGQTYILDRDSDGILNLAQNTVDPGNPYVGSATLNRGTVVVGSKTLQVEYFYGRNNSNYDTRAVSAFPRGFWSNEYYASADGGNPAVCAGGVCNTDILLYNPNNTNVTINWETVGASGTFTLTANQTGFFSDPLNANMFVPDGSGVYLKGTGVFWGTSDIDSNANNWDWGYSLVPSYLLSDDQTVAWAPGNSPAQACNTANARGNGLFLTPAADNTTIYIDTNGDGIPETSATNASIEVLLGQTPLAPTGLGYKVNRLQSVYITGSNSGTLASSTCDLTGARIYATGPFSMSYGENPDKTSQGGGLDLGYTVLPSPGNWMDLALTVDKTTSPVLVSTVAGATNVTYTLVVESHNFNIDTVSVVDTLPANWTYVPGSTTITLPNLTTINTNPAVALPTLTWGGLPNLLPNQRITITFQAKTTAAFATGTVTQNNVRAVGTRTVGGVLQTFKATDFAFNTFTDGTVGMQMTKTSSVPVATPVSPGDTLTYTVNVSNPAPAVTALTGVSVYDPLPPGVTYVPGSGSVTCQIAGAAANVRDQFDTNSSYAGNNGSVNWVGPWTETDNQGTTPGPTAGFVLVTGNRLRFRYQTLTYGDTFNGDTDYTRNTGTNNWNGPWTENLDDGAATTGFIKINTPVNNRLNFIGNTGAQANRSIQRTVNVSGASSMSVGFTIADGGIDAGETVVVEYSIDGGGFLPFGTLDGATGWAAAPPFVGNPPFTVNTVGATTLTLRFRAPQVWDEANDDVQIQNVVITALDAVGSSAQRTVNLANAINPQLTFTVPATANLVAADTLVVEASASPAGPFTTLATYTGNTTTGVQPYDLTPYASATTTIQFRVTGNFNATNKSFDIDNVNVGYTPTTSTTFASNAPPDLLPAAAGCVIPRNGSLSVTFNVTVDNPFPANQSEILNTASTSVNEIPVSLSASARNIVLVPGGLTGTVGDRIWLDTNANGIFDAGETGIGGVEVTLKDQFGTPIQVTTTDSMGRYTFINVPAGSGYYVEVTGGLPSGLSQTSYRVADSFSTNGSFAGSDALPKWLTSWTETGDDANAATGDIRIANNRIEFRDTVGTVAANESIQRSAIATGNTSIIVTYDWAGPNAGSAALLAGSDRVIVEYSTDGVSWTTLRTIDAAAAQTFTDNVFWTPTNNSFFLRYRTLDVLETNKLAAIDNVVISIAQPLQTPTFTVAAGQDYVDADLGFRASPGTASIGDLVWVDANNDQTRNPGEVGLAGVTVDLYQDTNGDGLGDLYLRSTVTGPGGAYLFTGIPADGILDYVVTMNTGQAALTGYTATTPTVFSYPNLPSGGVRVDADFGFRNPAGTFTISDGLWLDNGLPTGTANDGIRNGTEAGIGGVTVDLLDSAGNTIATTTTAANGAFQFTGVPGGQNYSWRVTDQAHVLADYYGTTPSALSSNFQMVGSLAGNLDFTATPHFGYNQTRTIGDTVFNDNGMGGGVAGNGVQDGSEPGISGVTVLLYKDVNGNGIFEPGGADGAPFQSVVTDAAGKYLFAGLPTGFQWFVSIDNTQSALTGFNLTTPDNSGVAGHQRQVTPALVGSNNRLDIDYGYRAAVAFNVSGRFFNDVNRNGIDNSEAGFQNVTVQLVNSSGVVVATTTTAADGSYSFVGQPAGTYTVRITDTNGVLGGAETTFEKTEGALAGSYNGQETVTLGPTVTNVNFGFYRANALVTRVVISSFLARDVQGALVLEWKTASEIGTIGFQLKRWDEGRKRYVGVNERLIPSLIGSTLGGTYRYVDREASPGQAYRYLIVEVEASGNHLKYGPYDVDTRVTATQAAPPEDEDGDAVEAEGRRLAEDALLLESGQSKTPLRGDLRKRLERRNASREDRNRAALRHRSTPAAKIGVSDNAFYFVTLQDLQTRGGMTVGPRWTKRYSLSNRGEPVAIAPSAQEDGFWFYGRATQSNLEKDNVYQLSDALGGARMGSRRNPPGQPGGSEVFVKTLHVEQDIIAANNVFKDPSGDFYVWDYVFAGYGAKSFPFRTDGATRTGMASLTLRLKGGSQTVASPDHHATFTLNGAQVGEAMWDGLDDLVATVDFDSSLLQDGENTLTIDGLLDTGAEYSLFYVDSFDLNYTSRYRAYGNKAEVPSAGNPSILISGFTRPDITLFDITIPTQPVFVQAPVVRTPDGTYGVVASSRDARAVYYALTPDALAPVARILPDEPSSLRQPGNQAEYVVITSDALKETAQRLADYRADLSSMVVDIEDIYDEFNFGNASPNAVRDFLSYAQSRWRTPPRYVVLAGDGTYDYKNVEGFGDNLIPPMMASTPEGLFPADEWFAERTGTRTEIAIGRLPVATTAELTEVIRKIQARETALALSEPWLRDTLLVADNADGGGDFVASSEAVAGVFPPGASVSRAYLSVDGPALTRARLIAGLNQGTGLVNYFGHGGFDYLADEYLLTKADAPALLNLDRPSVMVALTCLAGNAALPGYTVVGEELVRQPGGGLAALFAPSGMSQNDLATPLAEGLHAALLSGRTRRIGDAVNAARKAYKIENLPLYMLSIYNLLGDPALRVR
jgi:uncharacterized repeat protein (TIGR01451 family)